MPVLLCILFFIVMEINDAILSNLKWKSDHRLPANKIEEACGWAEIWGIEWMFKCPKDCPKEILEESWYRLKLHQHPDKDREWAEKVWPYEYDRPALPNKNVWENYWMEQTQMPVWEYEQKYPFLRWPSNRDEYGFMINC